MPRQKLEERWLQWWKKVGATGDGRVAFDVIATRYSEPHRAYHTLKHLEHCFQEFDRSKHLIIDHLLVLELAIWFHDVIYDPTAHHNEEHSAKLAQGLCRQARIGQRFGNLVAEFILLSKHGQTAVYANDARLFLDIDLAILGQPPERFWQYEREIRIEYISVELGEYRRRRAELLRGFLRRRYLYRTPFFREQYEAQARNNLTASIRALEA